MMPPTSIDGTDITGATIDGQEVQEITVDGQTVFSAGPNLPVAYSNLVAWYPFDSATYGGSDADDVTGILGESGDDTAYDGTVNGATYQSSGGVTDINAGANSGAFDFDGSADQIEAAGFPSSNFNDPHTMIAWIEVDSEPDDLTCGVGYIDQATSGNPRTSIGSKLGEASFNRFKTNIETGTITSGYHCVAGTYSGTGSGNMTLYLDGSQVGTATGTTPFDGAAADKLQIGSAGVPENIRRDMDGRIDGVRFYNAELTGSQINQIYQNTQP